MDDGNEGARDGECPEHVWRVAEVVFNDTGAYAEVTCGRCGAVRLDQPGIGALEAAKRVRQPPTSG